MIERLANLDRRVIYLLVLLALSVPLIAGYRIPPARMQAADKLFSVVEAIEPNPGKIAFLSLDYGPSTIAENGSQGEVLIEHLMRRRIGVAVASLTVDSTALLNTMPEKVAARLMKENPGEKWSYGTDWVNLGFLAGGYLAVQSIPKAESLTEFFKKDVRGNNLKDLPVFAGVKNFQDIVLLGEITGSVGLLEAYFQFFQTDKYRPIFVHGCTSIMTPPAYIYLDSGQLQGFFEGIAGAAWYSELLRSKYPQRTLDDSIAINTGLGVAHLVIIALVIMGNILSLLARSNSVGRGSA